MTSSISRPRVRIFDGHNDSVHLMREYKPGGVDFLERNDSGHLDLPRARQGGLFGGLFAIWVAPEQAPIDNLTTGETSYEVRMASALDHGYAKRETVRQLAALKAVAARSNGTLRIAVTAEEIVQAEADGAFAVVLHIEGAEAVGPDLSELGQFHAAGVRSIGPVWSRPNLFGCGVPFAFPRSPDTGPGLTPVGFELIRSCNRLGILVDVSHLNEKGFWDVARTSTAPLVATHSCAHALCPSARNLTDRQLDAIRDSDGIVGLNLSVNDLRPDAHRNADTGLDTVVRHFTYLVERLGIDRVALGSDFDGATIPKAIGDAAGLPNLVDGLRAAGFDDAAVNKIAHENWLRILRMTLRAC